MGRIVVTGANGFLGSNLVKEFLDNGHDVWVVLRPESKKSDVFPADKETLHFIRCTYSETEKLKVEIGMADAWFHFAWGGVNREEIDSPLVQEKNVEMSMVALDAAHELGCSVFMDAGSRVEYGITSDGVMSEEISCNPVNEYGKAKLRFYEKAKVQCALYGMKYCHLRFFSVYGYGDHPWSIISTLLRDLQEGKKVSLSACRHKWNFMYIKDAMEAVYRLYLSVKENDLKDDIFNIASADTRELKSFVNEIYQILGERGELEFGTFKQAKEGALSIIPNIERLKTTAECKERYTFHDGIIETLECEKVIR